ncbi:MAG TPA: ABC transporter permease [Gemmatimonadaceae bacterium]|nr:ABC transporter permease [Gemmatimonadaceae bacterium]
MAEQTRGRFTERLAAARDDLRYALRTLRKNPAFSVIAILTLALAIGMNGAIFSVVNGVLLRPLPFPAPDRLVRLWQVETSDGGHERGTVSAVNLDDWRARQHAFTDIGGYFYAEGMSGTDLEGVGEPQRLSTAFVTPGFWNALHVSPSRGRVPRDDEMVRGSNDRLIVLTDAFWRREFGASESAIGRRVRIGNDSYEIVGVMPPSFRFPAPKVDVYIPYSTIPDNAIPRIRPVRILQIVGRMRPGVTVAQASADINSVTRGLATQYPEDKHLGAADVAPLRDSMIGNVRAGLLLLLGAVGFVLLIAAVNLAGLMLARATARERELAIRVALGAERGRIVRQLLTESLVLAVIGGVLGLAVAKIGGALLLRLSSGQLPRASEVSLDLPVVLFTAVAAIVSGVVFGLVPALRAASPQLQASLREGTRGSTAGTGGLRGALVVSEVALAMVLVVGAGLMTRSFVKMLEVDLGFARDHRVAIDYSISSARHQTSAELRETYRAMLERVRAVPGVIAAGAIRDLPFHGDGEPLGFAPPGMESLQPDQLPVATLMFTSDGFFGAMGIPILAGRDLSPSDRLDAPPVLVVNEALARKYFPGRSPVGQTMTLGDTTHFAIVGVVGDVHQKSVDEAPVPRIYASVYQIFRVRTNLVVRTQGDPTLMIPRIEGAIRSVDPQQTITAAYTLDDAVSEAVARPRLVTVLLGLFGAMGLVLGALGIYGVLAYLVTQRTREIGVRIALGARTTSVLGMVVVRGVRLAAIGVVIGLVVSFALTRVMSGVLYGVSPTDPLTFGGVALTLLTVAALASAVPALRAARVDPLTALRAE